METGLGWLIESDGLTVGERKQKTWWHVTQVMAHCSAQGVAGQTASYWGDRGRRGPTGPFLWLVSRENLYVCQGGAEGNLYRLPNACDGVDKERFWLGPCRRAVMDDFVRSLPARDRRE